MYTLFITNQVKKELRKVQKQPLNRIYEAIESLKKEGTKGCAQDQR